VSAAGDAGPYARSEVYLGRPPGAAGSSGFTPPPPLPPIGFGAAIGQSNRRSIAGYQATNGSDSSYGVSFTTGFGPVLMARKLATAPRSPQTWDFDTGMVTLRAYAASGSNMGPEQTTGRYLVNYGVFANPVLVAIAVDATSLPNHWMKSSGFPASGTKLYDTMIQFFRDQMTTVGRDIEWLEWDQGEGDTGTQSVALAREANMHQMASDLRTDLGIPALPILVCQPHPQTTGAPYIAEVRAGNAAFVANDPHAVLLDFGDLRLNSNPHYDELGQLARGDRIGVAVRKLFFPGSSGNKEAGPEPWLQQADAGYPCVGTPTTISPLSGPEPKAGDCEYLATASYSAAATITLPVPAGFVQIANAESVAVGLHRRLTVWRRLLGAGDIDSDGRTAKPSVDFGAATINVARIAGMRGVAPWAADPTDAVSTGANNANNTALVLPGGTTTVNNERLLIFACTAGATNGVLSVVNADLTDIRIEWDGIYTPSGGGSPGLAIITARKAVAGAYGATTITFKSTGINVGAIIQVKP